MLEEYQIVDVKQATKKNGDMYWYAICYSSCEYIFKIFCSEEVYIVLANLKSNNALHEFNVARNVRKTFNQNTREFQYFIIS